MLRLLSIQFILWLLFCCAAPVSADTGIPNAHEHHEHIEGVFNIMPWKVGQFVEYQIISVENESRENRYKFSLIGQEDIEGKTYFWIQIDIYEYLFQKYRKLRKNISFQVLTLPVTSEGFSQNPAYYISSGFFFPGAIKLRVKIYDAPFEDAGLKAYFSHQDIIEGTLYSITPEAMGRIDFSRMQICKVKENIPVLAGSFECNHIFVSTDIRDEYYDEGFDLWRSSSVPLLGIVKMEFSKTLYWEKWSYKNETRKIRTVKDFLSNLYKKRVPGRRRPDTYVINLVRYG